MKKLLGIFNILFLLQCHTSFSTDHTFTYYPSSTTALAYDGQYFWIGQESKVLKWDKNVGVLAEYTPKNGLPGSWVREIYIAPDKKTIWAFTDSCVARFDGISWHTLTVSEGAPYAPLRDKAAFQQDGSFWILTENKTGLYRFDGTKWTHFTTTDGLVSNSVTSIAIDRENVIWIGTENGVSAYDGTTWKTYTTADGLSDNSVGHIIVDQNNVKWFGAHGSLDKGGITRFDGKSWTAYTMDNGLLSAKTVQEMVVGPDNTIWFSMGDIRYVDGKVVETQKPGNGQYFYYIYLYKYDGEKLVLVKSRVHYDYSTVSLFYQWFVFDNSGEINILSDIQSFSQDILRKNQLCDADNVIWFLEGWDSYYWLVRYDGERHPIGFGPPRNPCALAVGPQNELWVGERSGGLSEFARGTWNVSTYEYLSTTNFYFELICLAANNEETVWIGGGTSKLGKFQWGNPQLIKTQLPVDAVVSMSFDKDNAIWMSFGAFGKGVASYTGSILRQYTTADGLINDQVNSIAVDFTNTKWFGTASGVSRFDGSKWTTFAVTENGDSLGLITVIAAGANGTIWAGTNKGLLRYNGSTWTRLSVADGLADSVVLSLALNAKGLVLAGTPNGLSRYDGKTWKTFTTADGLPSNRVQALAVDHNDVVWIGTDKGLVSYTGEDIPVFVAEEAANPKAFPTLSVYPNPFNPSTLIECTITGKGFSELSVYSITGQQVKAIVSGNLSAGKHRFLWDGKDDAGHAVSSGTYIARLRTGSSFTSQKMVLVK